MGVPRLIVIGGWDGQLIIDDVVSAEIKPDGTLGAFSQSDALPYGVSGSGVGCIDNVIVIGAGKLINGNFRIVASTLVGRVTSDGITWSSGHDVPDAVFHASMATSSNRFYLSGGFDGVNSVDTVVVAILSDDSALSSWVTTTPLPKPMRHDSSFVHGDWLYTIGGLTGDPARNPTYHEDVWRAPIGNDGLIGQWQSLESLPATLVAHNSAIFSDYVWTLGGVKYGRFFTDEILRAQLRADGTLGPWSVYPQGLPQARAHVHQPPVWGHHIYSVGGHTDAAWALPFVWTGRFQ